MGRSDTARLSPAEGRRFAFPVGTAFLILAPAIGWRGNTAVAFGVGSVGLILLIAGLLIPDRLGPVHHAWMRFALLLSKVSTPIAMAILYFLVISPIGLLVRTFGKNPLVHEPTDEGYWVRRPAGPDRRSDLKRQF